MLTCQFLSLLCCNTFPYVYVAGFASFPDPQPAVPRPMSVNPFTVSMTLNVWQRIGLFFDSRKCNRTLSFRGTSTPAEERPKILSSDPADSSYTLLHLLVRLLEAKWR